jgi:hypothetical protein
MGKLVRIEARNGSGVASRERLSEQFGWSDTGNTPLCHLISIQVDKVLLRREEHMLRMLYCTDAVIPLHCERW